jgi:hypothetical protein
MLADFQESLEIASDETDIQILQRQRERKFLVQALHENQELKDAAALNINVFGLNLPSDKQPSVPFISLNQLKLEAEQQQLSKVLGPNFKGSITST